MKKKPIVKIKKPQKKEVKKEKHKVEERPALKPKLETIRKPSLMARIKRKFIKGP